MADDLSRAGQAQRITLIGAVVNLLLAAIKVALGVLGNSYALVVDGVHSLSDLATDVLVVLVTRYGSRGVDDDHPYGHQRFETAASVALGGLLLLTGFGILWDAVDRLFSAERLSHPGYLALVGVLLSIVAKEALYQYTRVVARRIKSSLLLANAWHHRSDAVSSLVVLVGIVGSMAGLGYLDAVAATLVSLMIMHIGWGLAWGALRELVDTGLEADRLQSIRDVIQAVPGVDSMHLLRTRRMGEDALVDVHIQLADPRVSVSEGHQVSEAVRARLLHQIDEVTDVTVHIDPENDAEVKSCIHLPARRDLMPQLREHWREIPEAGQIQELTLHYLSGSIQVEVRLPADLVSGSAALDALSQRFAAAIDDLPAIGGVRVLLQ